jgi:hypothetical protein
MIERITFNTSGWHEHERSEEWLVWGNAGDILSLAVVPVPWKTFKPMEREYWLEDARQMATPGGIVSVDPCTAAAHPAIQIIYKREEGSGYRYTGILVVEFEEHWCQVTVVCGERGITGVREAVLTPGLLEDRTIKIRNYPFYVRPFKRSSGYLEGWFTDPYDPKYKGAALRSVTDNEKYDEEFPDHPISRLRSTLKTVRDSLQFSH